MANLGVSVVLLSAIIGISCRGRVPARTNHVDANAQTSAGRAEVGSRRSWAVEYFRAHPGADSLQMIGEYNATALGRRLGYFSLDEARAIATEFAARER
jgi:hypothetical protein